VVAAEPDTFQEWVLGMPNEQYQGWIQNKFNWGGENEILILATRKFKLEIAVVSMESFSVLAYGTDVPATGRIYIIYTGQHYEPFVGMTGGVETRVFPIGTDEAIEAGCIEVARVVAAEKARKAAQRSKWVLKCGGCGTLCDDNEAFQAHCGEVEHDDEFMYDCEKVEVIIEADQKLDEGAVDLTSPTVSALYNAPSEPMANCAAGFPIQLDGVTYPSVHHYWHCAKFGLQSAVAEKIRAIEDPNAAENAGAYQSDCPAVADWQATGRVQAALEGMRAKFSQHAAIKDVLLATDDKQLVFLDTDTWAGVDNTGGIPKGHNNLGMALQQVRDELRGDHTAAK